MIHNIRKKLFQKKQKLRVNTDLHSHLIAEIDDGCFDINESVKIIKQLKNLGYTRLIITPHIMLKKYPNTIDIIKSGLFELRGMLKVKNIEIDIQVSAEYYCDKHFLELIKSKKLLPFGKKYILFELPYTTRPECLEEVLKRLHALQYKPVLAHPERYRFLTDVLHFRELKKSGVLFQINVNSLGGFYGKEVQKKAKMLAMKGMVDFIGSDIHGQRHMDAYEHNIFTSNMDSLFIKNKILNDII